MIDKMMLDMIKQAMANSLAPATPAMPDTITSVQALVNARLTRGTVTVYRAMVDLIEPDSVTFFLRCEGTPRQFTNVPMRVDLPRDGRPIQADTLAEYFARELSEALNVDY